MKRESLLILAALLIVVVAAPFWFLQGERVAPADDPGPDRTSEPSSAPSSAPATTALRDVTRSEVNVPPSNTTPDPAGEALLADPEIQAALTGFTGRLVDAKGEPMADRNMQIWRGDLASVMEVLPDVEEPRMDVDLLGGQGKTDPTGRFLITGVWPRALYLLVADAGGENPTFQIVERTPDPGQVVDLGDIRLKDCATLLGKVVDEDGQAVQGALVRATDLPGMALKFVPLERFDPSGAVIVREETPATVVDLPPWVGRLFDQLPIPKTYTVADGTFRLTGVDTGDVLVAVTARKFVSHVNPRVRLKVGEERDLGVVRLSQGESLMARVVDAHGKPVAGAETLVGQTSPAAPVDFVSMGPPSDEDGRFEVSGFPSGKVTVAARRNARSAWVIKEPASVTDDLVITLPTGFTLTMDVQDQDGRRIKDPTILLFPDMQDGSSQVFGMYAFGFTRPVDLTGRMQTAEDGRQVVQDLDAGRYFVLVRGKGFCDRAERVDLNKDALQVVRLKPSIPITVRVLDQDQRPIRNARVVGVDVGQSGSTPTPCGLTDAQGEVTTDRFQGGSVNFSASHPKYGTATATLESGQTRINIQLQTPGAIDGLLTEAGAAPAAGQWIISVSRNFWDAHTVFPSMPRLVTPGMDGRFKVEGLEPGSYSVMAMESLRALQSPGKIYSSMVSSFLLDDGITESVQIPPGQRVAVQLDTKSETQGDGGPSAQITGVVTVNGQPIPDLVVVVHTERRHLAHTTDRGHFDLGRVAAGEHHLRVQNPNASGSEEQLVWGGWITVVADQDMDLQIHVKTGKVTGTVYAAGGTAVDGCTIRVSGRMKGIGASSKTGGVLEHFNTVTDGAGRFELPSVPEGTYTVHANKKGLGRQSREDVPVQPGSAVQVELQLEQVYRLSGRLDVAVFGDKARAYGLTLKKLGESQTPHHGWANLRADGTFEVDDLLPGDYEVAIWVESREEGPEPSYVGWTVVESPLRMDSSDRADVFLRPVRR